MIFAPDQFINQSLNFMKSVFYTLFLVAFSLTAMAQIPTNGLQARFPFNNTLNDTTANAHSLSPVVNPTAVTYVAGHDTIGQALDLANANGCAYLISDTNFTFNDSTLTVSFWAFIDSNELTGLSPQALFATTNGTTNVASHSVEYQRGINAALLTCYAYYTPTYTNYTTLSFSVLPYLNQWHHYTYRYNKATPSTGMQLFIDGQLVAGRQVDGTLTVNAGSNQIKLGVAGGYCVTTTQYDELLVYDRDLSDTEIANIFNTQHTGCPQIIGTFTQEGQSYSTCPVPTDSFLLTANASYPTSGISYQWLKDGVAIPNATNNTYTYVTDEASSGMYTVQLTTNCDTFLFDDFTLTVYAAPAQPTITADGNELTCNTLADNYIWLLDGAPLPDFIGQQTITATANGDYTVVTITNNPGTGNNCESPLSAAVTITGVGISQVNNNISLNLYPNPVQNTIAIATSEVLAGVEVYNVMGQQVVSIAGNATQIDVTTLPAGTYYLNAITNQGTVRKPFVKL